jgi:hypothetical protein
MAFVQCAVLISYKAATFSMWSVLMNINKNWLSMEEVHEF